MNPERVGPDRLRIPRRAEGPSREVGDGLVEIGPDDPDYAAWAKWLDQSAADSE